MTQPKQRKQEPKRKKSGEDNFWPHDIFRCCEDRYAGSMSPHTYYISTTSWRSKEWLCGQDWRYPLNTYKMFSSWILRPSSALFCRCRCLCEDSLLDYHSESSKWNKRSLPMKWNEKSWHMTLVPRFASTKPWSQIPRLHLSATRATMMAQLLQIVTRLRSAVRASNSSCRSRAVLYKITGTDTVLVAFQIRALTEQLRFLAKALLKISKALSPKSQ